MSSLRRSCGIAYLLIESTELEPAKQGIGYLAALTVGMLPLAWVGEWLRHPLVGVFSYLILAAVVSLCFFVAEFVK